LDDRYGLSVSQMTTDEFHYAGAAGMLLHMNGKFTIGAKLKSSIVL
jgi:hypothetical protein